MSDNVGKRSMQRMAEHLADHLDEVNREIIKAMKTAIGFRISGTILTIASALGAIGAAVAIPFTGGLSSLAIPAMIGLSATGGVGTATSIVAEVVKKKLTDEKIKKAEDMWKLFCTGMDAIMNLEYPDLRRHFYESGKQFGDKGLETAALLTVNAGSKVLSASQKAVKAAKSATEMKSAVAGLKVAAKGAAQASKIASAMAGSIILNAVVLSVSIYDIVEAARELSDLKGNGPLSHLPDCLREFAKHGDIRRAFC